jgi:hypothetical protein
MALHEQAVGEPVRPVRQSPTRSERPVDAEHDRGVAPRTTARDAEQEGERSPL